jgi:hypothetical protein
MRAKEVEPIVGVEKKPDGAGGWLMEEKVNPPNPEASPTMEFTEFARFPISRGEKFSGKIDEIRVGKTLRDVLP